MLQLDIFTKPIRESAVSGIKEFLRKKKLEEQSLFLLSSLQLDDCLAVQAYQKECINNETIRAMRDEGNLYVSLAYVFRNVFKC